VAREVGARAPSIRACYEGGLAKNPKLAGGKVVMHWTITQEGNVGGVGVEQDTFGDGEVAACITRLVATWRFPAPTGGSIDIAFPFVFRPDSPTK